MKTESIPSCIGWIMKKIKKLWAILMVFILLIVHMGIFILKDFSFGYRYYEFNQQTNIKTTVGYSVEKIDVFSIIENYLEQLKNDGYYIASYEITKTFCDSLTIVHKNKFNYDYIKKDIINSLEIDIFCKKVTIGKSVYYFKNETDKNKFVNELNSIKHIEYSSEEVIEEKSIITKQDILDKTIKEAKEKKEQEERQKKQVTSRSNTTRNSSKKYNAPLASYVYISSYYGTRNGSMHTGVDFAANGGTEIYAWKSGVVTYAGWKQYYGNFIIVEHNDGTISRYAHCRGFAVSKGQTVTKGQTIGYVGTTGNSTGNHLHFEIQINGNFVNPLNYI